MIRSVSSGPWTSEVTSWASAFCPARRNGFSSVCCSRSSISVARQEREDAQQLADLDVLDVEPELVEGVRRHHRRVEPQGAALGLAVLRAVGLGHQRRRERVRVLAGDPADQVDAAGEVAPLVAPAELQPDAVGAEELEVVHRLQQHVAELGVADAALEPRPDDLAGQHAVDREVLADVAEEVDRREVRGPLVVVDHRRGVVALEGQERLDLLLHPGHPLVHGVERVHGPLAAVARVADQPGGATDEEVRHVAGVLEPAGGHDLHEVAHVQARRGRVEADVEPDRARRPSRRAGRRDPSCARAGRATPGRRSGAGRWTRRASREGMVRLQACLIDPAGGEPVSAADAAGRHPPNSGATFDQRLVEPVGERARTTTSQATTSSAVLPGGAAWRGSATCRRAGEP